VKAIFVPTNPELAVSRLLKANNITIAIRHLLSNMC
jgi:hypothetical protein